MCLSWSGPTSWAPSAASATGPGRTAVGHPVAAPVGSLAPVPDHDGAVVPRPSEPLTSLTTALAPTLAPA